MRAMRMGKGLKVKPYEVTFAMFSLEVRRLRGELTMVFNTKFPVLNTGNICMTKI